MIIRNPKRLVYLENLRFGAVFQKGNNYYIKTDAKSVIANTDGTIKNDCTCINLENGHWTYFSNDDLVYFYDAELIL